MEGVDHEDDNSSVVLQELATPVMKMSRQMRKEKGRQHTLKEEP